MIVMKMKDVHVGDDIAHTDALLRTLKSKNDSEKDLAASILALSATSTSSPATGEMTWPVSGSRALLVHDRRKRHAVVIRLLSASSFREKLFKI
jgi:uncharacterized membrane protein